MLAVDLVADQLSPTSFWNDAWRDLRERPLFIISGDHDRARHRDLRCSPVCSRTRIRGSAGRLSMQAPTWGALVRFRPPGLRHLRAHHLRRARVRDRRRGDTICLVLVVGTIFGRSGGVLRRLARFDLSRVADIFFAHPADPGRDRDHAAVRRRTIWTVVAILARLRLAADGAHRARGGCLGEEQRFITAAQALGVVDGSGHCFATSCPNALGPIIVVSTISLGVFIVTEATLSYLGIGLPATSVSWGIDISNRTELLRSGSPILFYPATALALTVLSFIMMGDALRDALDPKARKR